MRRIALFAALCICICALSPGSIGIGIAAVLITEWGTTIDGSGETYELASDLHDDGTSPFAVTVAPGVHDIVLQGAGHAIIGDFLASSFEGGIRIDGTGGEVVDVRIEGIRFEGLDAGIAVEGSACHVTIRGCDFVGLTDGRAVSFRTVSPGDRIRWAVVRDSRIRSGRCLGVVFDNGGNAAGAGAEISSASVLSNTISDLEAPAATPEPLRASVLAVGGVDRLRVRDNVILGGEDLSGVLISSRDEPGERFDRVSVTGNVIGGRSGADGTATAVAGIKLDRIHTSSAVLWDLQQNLLFGNEGAGIDLLPGAPGLELDARRCWWGDDAGPDGVWGDGVSAGIRTDPVLDLPDGLSLHPSLRLGSCSGWWSVAGILNQDVSAPGMRGFDADVTIRSRDASLVDHEPGGWLARTGLPVQYFLTGEEDDWTVTGAILGGGPPLAVGNGDLFRLLFRGEEENVPIGFDAVIGEVRLRDPDNGILPLLGRRNGRMTIDCSPPEVSIDGFDDCGVAVITIRAFDYDLDELFVRVAPGCWRFVTQDECEDGLEIVLRIEELAGLPDGEYEIQVCVTDDAGNETLATWPFTRDTAPPASVAGVHAEAAHNRVLLSWTPSAYPVEVVRKGWVYPEYDDEAPSPGFPVDPSDGALAAVLPPGSGSFEEPFSDLTRNAYFYTLFHRDECGRASAADPGSHAAALSYWLGDLTAGLEVGPPYDGYVSALDLAVFSAGFGSGEGDPGYDPQLDIGPTDTGYVDGIPLTDDRIDFEDVILLSINYGQVVPGLPDLPLPEPAEEADDPVLVLAVSPGPGLDLYEATLSLAGNGARVKGVRALLTIDRSLLRFVGAEPLGALAEPQAVFFDAREPDAGTIDLCAVVIGGDRSLTGNGPLARILLRRMGGGPGAGIALVGSEIRDPRNRPLGGPAPPREAPVPPEAAPARCALLAAVPNPARGATRIRFLLDRPGSYEVAIYDAAGRRVRLLEQGKAAAGLHGTDWDGRRDDGREAASGIYHARLRTDRGGETRRIALIR